MSTQRFTPLSDGASIGVFAPGAPARADRVEAGCAALTSLGYQPKLCGDPSAFYGNYEYLFSNGSAAERADQCQQLFADDGIAGILAARGAYGCFEILPLLDYDLIQKKAKPLVGYSDVTALLIALQARSGVMAIHGPTLSKEWAEWSESEDARQSVASLERLWRGTMRPGEAFFAAKSLRKGEVAGPLLVANLTVLVSLLGTHFQPDFEGRILVVEDIGEAPFRIHRSLLQLFAAGAFRNLAGLIFGRFDRCDAKNGPSVDEVIRAFQSSYLAGTTFPILIDAPVG
ncbi:MAG: LD-carboxypeptidase, partial [Bdellovibrionales bacterium]|nr:LD-carboxypeptidase [Bdellovibrionales bacterium]